MVVLNTDHLSVLEWENSPAALQIRAHLENRVTEEVGTTIINFEEIWTK